MAFAVVAQSAVRPTWSGTSIDILGNGEASRNNEENKENHSHYIPPSGNSSSWSSEECETTN